MPLCQLCDEPGADKRWSASLQMAAWAAAAWGVGLWVVMVRGVITVLLHFQVKMGTHKRKSIVGSMLRFACLSHSLTHTGSLSAVWFLLCCRGCCVCVWWFRFVESPLENTTASGSGNDILAFPSDILLPRQPGGNCLSGDCRHMWKRQQSKCVQCRVKRTCYATAWICWAMSGKRNKTSHNICFWSKSLMCHHTLKHDIILIYFVCIAGYEEGPFYSHPGFSLCAFTVWLWVRGHRKERTLKTETSFRQSEICHKTNFYNYHTIVKSLKSKWHLVQNTHTNKHLL